MCEKNPRTCIHAPDNKLADEIRTAILRWPAHRKALVSSIMVLGTIQSVMPSMEHINEIQCIFKTIEAALAAYSREGLADDVAE